MLKTLDKQIITYNKPKKIENLNNENFEDKVWER
jgi:hypothetical protein